MRAFLVLLLTIFIALSFVATDANAKRFGGGKSFGMSRSINSNRATHSGYAATPQSRPASSMSKWLGPLAGLAVGGLLASLFMGHGLGAGLMSWLMVGGIAFLIWRLFSQWQMRNQQQIRPSRLHEHYQTEPANMPFNNVSPFAPKSTLGDSRLNQFDETEFLRLAKTIFIRLQAAYDAKNLADIREFTLPDIFAEVQMQIQERGDVPNYTEVLHIDASLINHEIESDSMIASVMFTGQIRETRDAAPETIKETWHFKQDKLSRQWLVAGIQQA